MDWVQLISSVVIGLGAGLLGGLAGVGGSILILPSLGMVFGYPNSSTHHLYMAAAMTVNVAVAIPAALRHRQAGLVRMDLLRVLVPVTAAWLAVGVIASNFLPGWQLQILLAVFLVGYCAYLVGSAVAQRAEAGEGQQRITTPRLAVSAALAGSTAGLLGLGGGVLQVPLLQVLCKVPLRQAIGTSSAVICLTAVVGAGLKLATLRGEGESAWEALVLAAVMIPTAVLGARLGAGLMHKLPLNAVRVAITVVLLISAWRLAAAGGKMAGWW